MTTPMNYFKALLRQALDLLENDMKDLVGEEASS